MPWPMWPVYKIVGAFVAPCDWYCLPWPMAGREEQTASLHAPLMIGNVVSHNSEILSSEGDPVSSVHASGTGNKLSALVG